MSPNFGFLKSSVRMMVANRLAAAGALILVIFVLLVLAAPTLTRLHVMHALDQQDEQGLDADGLPHPAGGVYLLGTDNHGRDMLAPRTATNSAKQTKIYLNFKSCRRRTK